MKKKITLFFVLMFVFACSAIAETLPDEFFLNGIDARIAKCERKAALLKSRGRNTRAAGEKAQRELEFLNNYRAKLAGEMTAEGLPMKGYKVDYFLIKAYSEGTGNLAGK